MSENDFYFIQIASATDVSDIVDVHIQTWVDTYPNDEFGLTIEMVEAFFSDRAQIEKNFAYWFTDENSSTWIAKHESKTVGYCTVTSTDSENIIHALYVQPEHQKMKVGFRLLEVGIKSFANDNPIILTVAETNKKAINFYERYGFEIFDRVPEADLPAIGEVKLPLIKMRLE